MINPPVRSVIIYPVPETLEPSDDQTRRVEKKERNKQALEAYNKEVRRRKAEDNAKFNVLQIGDIDKKIKSQLYLALDKERQKNLQTKTLVKEYSIEILQNFGNS